MNRVSLIENNLVGVFIAAMGIAGIFIAGDWAEREPAGWLSVGSVIGIAMSLGTFGLALRFALAGVEMHHGVFRIRNFLRTYAIPMSRVRQFRISRTGWLGTPNVVAELDDGHQIPVNALGPSPLQLFRQRERLDAALLRLNESVGGVPNWPPAPV